ncbi:hypothetical protein [Halobacillus halophilus]|nr:hypothetical protein [Halobacillus halophilus]
MNSSIKQTGAILEKHFKVKKLPLGGGDIMLKKSLVALIIFVAIAFPAFYLISGKITWEMVLRTGIGYIAAIIVLSIFAKKRHT